MTPDERKAEIIRLRDSGKTWAEIGETLGLSLSRAHAIYAHCYDDVSPFPLGEVFNQIVRRRKKCRRQAEV